MGISFSWLPPNNSHSTDYPYEMDSSDIQTALEQFFKEEFDFVVEYKIYDGILTLCEEFINRKGESERRISRYGIYL